MSQEALPILKTQNLTYRVDQTVLVDNISIEVQRGETLAVVGPSGAGKSTFLRLLNRLDEPTDGFVFIENQDYRKIPPAELRRQVGMVMQQPYLFPGTVQDNLRYGPLSRAEHLTDRSIEQLLERVNLAGFARRDTVSLSGGEAQRVSLARTLANNPKILLLDEPTSALDDESQADVEALITSIIQSKHITCLIVTHDSEQAARMARWAMLMDKGKLVISGTVEEVLHA